MSMTPERWSQIKALLDALADIAPDERSTWLEEACDDPQLRQEVESYLLFEDDVETFEAPESGAALLARLDEDEKGDLVGPYRLEELLGRGGMGSVYRARREEDFEQRVALKLVRSGIETRETLERFHTERQILAKLEHPNIARLLDGGTSEGRPYFVMELIDGVPIDQFCEENRLSIRLRIRLLLQICDALAFAHRNLVLHLDLKPGNILVTKGGVPKLLDFGIGELLGHAQGAVEVRQRRMTVSYASPEQLAGESLSTSSDLYSLAVMLYELLTGRLPCGAYSRDQTQLVLAICGIMPSPPSHVVTRTEKVGFAEQAKELEPEEVAATRDRSPTSLRRRLQGDLDAITLRALNKDPESRYPSVGALALDLQRHLDILPVAARGEHPAYVAGKFIRRHRWALSIGAFFVTLVLGFTAALSNQLERTERERRRATHLSDFMVGLFRAAEPDRAGEPPSVRELVDIGRERLDMEMADEPEVRAQLLTTLGQVYYRLGFYDEALEAQGTSLSILEETFKRDRTEIAKALNDLGVISYTQGSYAEAEDFTRRSIAMRQRLGDEANTLKSQNTLASILMLKGRLDEAAELHEEILDQRRQNLGPRHPNVARSLRNLARVQHLGGHFERAEEFLREALDIRLEAYGRESAAVASTLASLGRVAHAREDWDDADHLYREALEIRRRLLGEESLNVAILRGDLAALMVDRGELDTAAVLFSQAFAPIYRHRPPGDWSRADLESAYGNYLAARGRNEEAIICLEGSYKTLIEVRGPNVLLTQNAERRLDHFRAETED